MVEFTLPDTNQRLEYRIFVFVPCSVDCGLKYTSHSNTVHKAFLTLEKSAEIMHLVFMAE